jgi:hypothetical protein
MKRIESACGTVQAKRVNGDLAVSRAFGDYSYKQTYSLPAELQQVSAEPEIHVEAREPAEDQYLVLACDGIWDVMSNEDCAKYIKDEVAMGVPNLGLVGAHAPLPPPFPPSPFPPSPYPPPPPTPPHPPPFSPISSLTDSVECGVGCVQSSRAAGGGHHHGVFATW